MIDIHTLGQEDFERFSSDFVAVIRCLNSTSSEYEGVETTLTYPLETLDMIQAYKKIDNFAELRERIINYADEWASAGQYSVKYAGESATTETPVSTTGQKTEAVETTEKKAEATTQEKTEAATEENPDTATTEVGTKPTTTEETPKDAKYLDFEYENPTLPSGETPKFYSETTGYEAAEIEFEQTEDGKWKVRVPVSPGSTKVEFVIILSNKDGKQVTDGESHSVEFDASQNVVNAKMKAGEEPVVVEKTEPEEATVETKPDEATTETGTKQGEATTEIKPDQAATEIKPEPSTTEGGTKPETVTTETPSDPTTTEAPAKPDAVTTETAKPAAATEQPAAAERKEAVIKAKSYEKELGCKPFSLKAKCDSDGKLTHKSSNKKVAVVSSKGKVQIKGIGTAKITISVPQTAKYKAAKKTVKIKVVLGQVKGLTPGIDWKGSDKILTISWKKVASASGYEVWWSKKSYTSKDCDKKTVSSSQLKTGLYNPGSNTHYVYVKVRAYKVIKGKKQYGKWGKYPIKLMN